MHNSVTLLFSMPDLSPHADRDVSALAVFPVYFKTAVHLSPAATNAVLAATPLFLAPFSFLARYMGRHIGERAGFGSDTAASSPDAPPSRTVVG